METLKAAKIMLVALVLLAVLAAPASAGTKEQLIQLQTQVQALQDQMARMQMTFDERMGIMRNLVEQTSDSVNKMAGSVSELNRNLAQQTSASDTRVDQVSTQIQALQDSIDELKARLARVSTQLQEVQSAQQTLIAPPAGMVGAQAQAPPPDVLYNNALRDYNAGQFQLAQQQFQEYLQFYPTTDLAGNAQFYLADILYRAGNYQQAVQEYDKVLEQYPGGNKTAAAHLKKGYALLELGNRQAGVKELQTLLARYPRTTEATQARERLRRLGAPTASKPSPSRRID